MMWPFFQAYKSKDMNWRWLGTQLVVLLLADTVVLSAANEFNGFSSRQLIFYNLFAFPLWSMSLPRKLIQEIPALVDSSRWVAVGTLPIPACVFFVVHQLVRVLKSQTFLILSVALILFDRFEHPEHGLAIFLLPLLVMAGGVALSLIYFICLVSSPKGQASLIATFVYSLFWLFSGAIVPLDYIFAKNWLYYVNPVSFAVSVPISKVFLNSSVELLPALIGVCIWNLALLSMAISMESLLRRKLYA